MILNLDFIAQQLGKDNEALEVAKKEYIRLQVHINGVGTAQYLDKIVGFDNDEQLDLRRKYAKSNKHIFSSLLRPADKVFSAKGGSKYYNLSDSQLKTFDSYISNIGGGFGITKWLENIWFNKYASDPNGIIFLEVKDNKPYPTYKAVPKIHDYKTNGTKLEYVIFSELEKIPKDLDEGKSYHRVVDEKMDYLILYENETATVVEEYSFKNPFNTCPGWTCSDIPSPVGSWKVSPIDNTVELADEYLRDNSVHSIYKFLHGYPIYWQYVANCYHCRGTGKIDGEKCGYCGGTGKDLKKDVSKVFGIETPKEGQPEITPPAGYVQPDLETWQKQLDELDFLYKAMHFAMWGTDISQSTTDRTATEIMFVNVHPVNERLTGISETAERLEQNMTNLMLRYFYANHKGSSISYGKRFLIETPDQVWKKYQEAREKGSPEGALNNLLEQYYESEFKNQPMQLERALKLMAVEPLLHVDISILKDLELSRELKNKKILFADWANSLTNADIMIRSEEQLKQMLNEYIQDESTSYQTFQGRNSNEDQRSQPGAMGN